MALKAFTLSELLIALALLGLVAAFTIPKVLQSADSQFRDTSFKETIGILAQAFQNFQNSSNPPTSSSDTITFFSEFLNIKEICESSTKPNACMDASYPSDTGRAVLLHNGMLISDIDGTTTWPGGGLRQTILIDYNGTEGPNTEGEDIINLNFHYGSGPYNGIPSGRITTNVPSRDLYNSLW